MIWWYTIWPGWLGYLSELFNGLITLPVVLSAQMGILWLWGRRRVKREVARQVAKQIAPLHERIANLEGAPSAGSEPPGD